MSLTHWFDEVPIVFLISPEAVPVFKEEELQSSRYEIRIRETLSPELTEWFEGMEIRQESNGGTVLAGPVSDQAALHGLLARVRDLNLILISVNPESPAKPAATRRK